MRAGGGPLPLLSERGGRCPPAVRPADVIERGMHPALFAACAATQQPSRAVVWAGRSHHLWGVGRLPRAAGPGVCDSAAAAGLAEGVQAAGSGASGTLSRVCSAVGLPGMIPHLRLSPLARAPAAVAA
jgi:hypothetical protein